MRRLKLVQSELGRFYEFSERLFDESSADFGRRAAIETTFRKPLKQHDRLPRQRYLEFQALCRLWWSAAAGIFHPLIGSKFISTQEISFPFPRS